MKKPGEKTEVDFKLLLVFYSETTYLKLKILKN